MNHYIKFGIINNNFYLRFIISIDFSIDHGTTQ